MVEIAAEEAAGARRRCLVGRTTAEREAMVRFVVGPEGRIVADVAGRLPGRGFWLSARADVLNTALDKNLFAKAARAAVRADRDLAAQVEALLVRRCLDWIGLARRAHQAVAGFDRVRGELGAGRVAVLLTAADAGADGRRRLGGLAAGLPRIEGLSSVELGQAFGREPLAHGAVAPGRLARRLLADARRLEGFRPGTLREPMEDDVTLAEDRPG